MLCFAPGSEIEMGDSGVIWTLPNTDTYVMYATGAVLLTIYISSFKTYFLFFCEIFKSMETTHHLRCGFLDLTSTTSTFN